MDTRDNTKFDELNETISILIEALQPFAKLDQIRDMGGKCANTGRDYFLKSCPEYIGYCQAARDAIDGTKQEGFNCIAHGFLPGLSECPKC